MSLFPPKVHLQAACGFRDSGNHAQHFPPIVNHDLCAKFKCQQSSKRGFDCLRSLLTQQQLLKVSSASTWVTHRCFDCLYGADPADTAAADEGQE